MTPDEFREVLRDELRDYTPPRMVSVAAAADALGIAERACWDLVDRGEGPLRSVMVGRRRLVPVEAIDEYVASITEGAA